MRKLRLLFASMFALLAWNGAFAQTNEEYEAALAAVEDGTTYRICTDVNGTTYYVTTDGLLTSVKTDAGFFAITKTSGGEFGTGFRIDSGSKRFTNPPLSNNVANLTPGAFATTTNDRADWERQILYLNGDGKYAIRSCNVVDGTSSWNDAGRTHWTWTVDPVTPCYSYEPAYVWELEVPAAIVNVAYRVVDGNGDPINTYSVKQEAYSEVNLPAELKNSLIYNYSVEDGVIGEEDCTITVIRSFKAGIVHALTDLSNNKAYTISCDRGALLTKDNYLASTAHSTLKAAQATEFAVISYEDNYYLYSVADKKFVTNSGALAETLTNGADDAIKIEADTDPYFFYYFTIGGTNNGLNTNGNDPYGYVINTWMTKDPGNLYYMIESADFDSEEAIKVLEDYYHPRTIESDLTSQFSALTVASNWKNIDGGNAGYTATNFCPAVTTNAGQTVQVCEYYRGSCDYTGEVLSQTVTGLVPGTYRFELYGAAAFTFGRGFGSTAFTGDLSTDNNAEYAAGDKIEENTGVTLYAETSNGTYGGEIPIYYATDFPNGASVVVLDGVVVGEDGTVKIGMSKTSTSTNWHVIQLKGVTAIAKFADVVAIAEAEYDALNGKVMEFTVAENMNTAKAIFNADDSDENLNAFQAAVAAAKASAEAYTNAAAALEAMKALIDATNFYTEEAYNEYYATPKTKYDARTLTTAEALAIQNPNVVTGWHAALTVDNFLLSVWDAEPDFASSYYINSWSVEGDNDGTGFHVPFFEYWTGDGDSLGEKELTATIEGLEPGNYGVSVWARVRVKNNEYLEDAHGITFVANDGEPVDVTAGDIVAGSQFRLAKFTANGVVAEDGVLTVKFIVDADNDISWLSFKNVNYTLLKSDITSLSGEFAEVNNAKLAKQWVSNGDPAFELSCPLNFMTAAGLEGGAWNSVSDIIDDPYIGFYSNGDENCYFAVSAPNGIKITSLVFNAAALKGAPTLYADGIDPVELTVAEQEITIPYDNVPVAKFHVGGEVAWMKATITVNYLAAAGAQSTPIATGVNTVKTVAAPAAIYNVAGQRVNNAVKGIYIINGKKVVK